VGAARRTVRNKIRVYQSTGGGHAAAGRGECAADDRDSIGYTAAEDGDPGRRRHAVQQSDPRDRRACEAVREAVGPDVDIGVDVHAKFFEAERAIRLAKAIEPYNPMWMEESVRPENYDAMKKCPTT
jgi:galactonate dehydratase